ncbi:MAG: rRNA small subunit methyltransferase B [Promicromonosporaceae bacterium]|nr:rRNA small subunit methyltransferase B [Promicromonosporaceae bacterium]
MEDHLQSSPRDGGDQDSRRGEDSHWQRRDQAGRQRGQARLRGDGRRSAQAPGQRRRVADAPRNAAFDVLRQVEASDAYANLVLPPLLRERRIEGRDAAFATELTYGTLRLRGRYDAIIARCIDQRTIADLDRPLLDVLRLGAHQILSMRVPPHAAVSETVALTRDRIGVGAGQFANAVLRRITEKPSAQWLDELRAEAAGPLAAEAVVASHPLWIARALRDALAADGRDPDELGALLAADNAAPRVTLVARPGLVTADELERQALRSRVTLEPGRWLEQAWIIASGDPGRLWAVRDGRAGVQDEGSQIVALALAVAPLLDEGGAPGGSDRRWLDLCAGPGGKAALLGAVAAQRGAELTANELQPHRADLVADSVQAVPSRALERLRVGDGREVGTEQPGAFDRVLVDAPCTGLGALRRRPESRWRRQPADVPTLARLQRELLTSALQATRPGGVVAYVTCSPHLAETRQVVDAVLADNRFPAERLDAPAVVASVVGPPLELGGGPDVQLWPHVHGTDAMHLSLLRRR